MRGNRLRYEVSNFVRHFRKIAGLMAAALAGDFAWPAQITDDHPGLQATERLVVMIEGSFGKGAGVVFAVENGQAYIATMFHVVRKQGAQGGDDVRAQDLKVRFRQREREAVEARHYEEASFENDLAVIRAPVSGLSFDFARLGDPKALRNGAFAYAVGQPGGERWGVTYQPGSISAVGAIWVRMQSAYVEPGHSGGALMDQEGRIIGLVKQTGGSTPQALRIDIAVDVLTRDLRLPVQLTAAGSTPILRTVPQVVASPTVPTELAAGSERTNAKDGLKYVWIPPGSFRMGCSEQPKDKQCDKRDELPTHAVTISKGFWIGQTEVTQEAYQRVVATNPSYFKGARRPVEEVSWTEAQAYCTAVGLRLPTEAEWEYAARAGTGSSWYGGGAIGDVAWYRVNSNSQTHDVKGKAANAWNLFDMLGNVREWTADWYDASYYKNSPRQDPKGPATGTSRVSRGGAWSPLAVADVRLSDRFGVETALRLIGVVGFRCAGELR